MKSNRSKRGFRLSGERIMDGRQWLAGFVAALLFIVTALDTKPATAQSGAGNFPENRVEIMKTYLPSHDVLLEIRNELDRLVKERLVEIDNKTCRLAPEDTLRYRIAELIQGNRNKLLDLLAQANKLDNLYEAYDLMAKEEFDAALRKIANFAVDITSLERVEEGIIGSALKQTKTEYTVRCLVSGGSGTPIKEARKEAFIDGYQGPRLDTKQIQSIVDFYSLITGGKEMDFRLGVLRAECYFGLEDYNVAIKHYRALLAHSIRIFMP